MAEPYGAVSALISSIERSLREPYTILSIIKKWLGNIGEIKTIFINDGIPTKMYIFRWYLVSFRFIRKSYKIYIFRWYIAIVPYEKIRLQNNMKKILK